MFCPFDCAGHQCAPDSLASKFSIDDKFFDVGKFVPPRDEFDLTAGLPIHIRKEDDFFWIINEGGVIFCINVEYLFVWFNGNNGIGDLVMCHMKDKM